MSEKHTVSKELKEKWDKAAALYEEKRAAMLPVLRLSQEHFGYISPEVEEEIAVYMDTTPVHVREVVSFYELFYTEPVGKYNIQFCHTLTCNINGCEDLIKHTKDKIGAQEGETSKDGKYTFSRAECLGACEMAPMMKINKDIYGPLTKDKIDEILKGLE